jgi:alpha-ketoglutarate-dependent taurine dioxygenase
VSDLKECCRRYGLQWEWLSDGILRTSNWAPGVLSHPETGEKAFFNQVQLHHIACLEPATRGALLDLFGPERLPRRVTFGDGSEIDESIMEDLLITSTEAAICFSWHSGDVLLVDNILVAHGRKPFQGPRQVYVALSRFVDGRDVTGHVST